jgi:hypothetical protein
MSKTVTLESNWLSQGRSAIKTNKLLLNSFYTHKVFNKIYCSQAIAPPGETHSETFINLVVKMSLAIAIASGYASGKNAGQLRIEAGGL